MRTVTAPAVGEGEFWANKFLTWPQLEEICHG
jgi:hypothetical protein